MANHAPNSTASQGALPARMESLVPTAVVAKIAPIDRRADLVTPRRLAKLIPRQPTGREKAMGREVVYRAGVQEGHRQLQEAATTTIGQMQITPTAPSSLASAR